MHKPISNSSSSSHSDNLHCVYLPGKASVTSPKLPEESNHRASSQGIASDGLAHVGPDTEVGGGVYDQSWFRDKHCLYESSQSDLLALDACQPTTPVELRYTSKPQCKLIGGRQHWLGYITSKV